MLRLTNRWQDMWQREDSELEDFRGRMDTVQVRVDHPEDYLVLIGWYRSLYSNLEWSIEAARERGDPESPFHEELETLIHDTDAWVTNNLY